MNVRMILMMLVTVILVMPWTVGAGEVSPPKGFQSLFNGKDLKGWYGWSTRNPEELWNMSQQEQAQYKQESRKDIKEHWSVDGDELVNDGFGLYLTTEREFTDYELWIDYKTVPQADSGIYLKGVPQIQIWDFRKEGGKWELGADKGSGGLWNNSKGAKGKDPLVLADNNLGEWNRFRVLQIGSRTSVWLNGHLVVDHAILENYFDRSRPLFHHGPIQLQTHGGEIRWRNIYIREIKPREANRILRAKSELTGYRSVFNGRDFDGWDGPLDNYEVVNGSIKCKTGNGGTIFTKDTYKDFSVRLNFKLPPAGNNGLAIRYPGSGNTAYDGMCELQVLDTGYPDKLDPRQVHGSAYGMVPAHPGYLRPAEQWNYQEVLVKGSTIKVELNGSVILDADLSQVTEFMSDTPHPGKDRLEGHFGFAGHNDPVLFRNIEIKKLD